jgi:hypothetical protein
VGRSDLTSRRGSANGQGSRGVGGAEVSGVVTRWGAAEVSKPPFVLRFSHNIHSISLTPDTSCFALAGVARSGIVQSITTRGDQSHREPSGFEGRRYRRRSFINGLTDAG